MTKSLHILSTVFTHHSKTVFHKVRPSDSTGNKLKHKYIPYRNVDRTVSQLCILVTPHWNTSLSDSRNVALFSSNSGWQALSTTHSFGSHSQAPKLQNTAITTLIMESYALINSIQGGCKVSTKHNERLVVGEYAQQFPLEHCFSVGQLNKIDPCHVPLSVHMWLNKNITGQCIGQQGPRKWPPCNLFLCGLSIHGLPIKTKNA